MRAAASTPEQIEEIRVMYVETTIPCRVIAEKYSKSEKAIRSMANRYDWPRRQPQVALANLGAWNRNPLSDKGPERREIGMIDPSLLEVWNRAHVMHLKGRRFDEIPIDTTPWRAGQPLCERTQARLNATIRAHKAPRRADAPCDITTEIVVDLRTGERQETTTQVEKPQRQEAEPRVNPAVRCPVCQIPMPHMRDYQRYCSRRCYQVSRGNQSVSNCAPPADSVIVGPTTKIQAVVSAVFRVPIEIMSDPGRRREYAWPRHAAMHLCSKFLPSTSLPQLGRMFGGRDHTTILHGIGATEKRLKIGEVEPTQFSARYWEAEKRVRLALEAE